MWHFTSPEFRGLRTTKYLPRPNLVMYFHIIVSFSIHSCPAGWKECGGPSLRPEHPHKSPLPCPSEGDRLSSQAFPPGCTRGETSPPGQAQGDQWLALSVKSQVVRLCGPHTVSLAHSSLLVLNDPLKMQKPVFQKIGNGSDRAHKP